MAEKINIAHFCISSPKESNGYTRIYLAEPEKKFLEKFGRLGILINLGFRGDTDNQTISQAKEWIQTLIDFISSNFYNTTRSASDLEKEFEDLLQKTNKWLQSEKARQRHMLEKYITDIDIDVMVIFGQKIHFSQIGDIKTYLIPAYSAGRPAYPTGRPAYPTGRPAYPTGEPASPAGRPAHPAPPISESQDKMSELSKDEKSKSLKFSNVISGALEQNNILLFTNKNLFDYFSTKKITQILKELPAKKAILEIKKLLPEGTETANLLCLIVSNRDESLLPISEPKPLPQKPDKEADEDVPTKVSVKKTTVPVKKIKKIRINGRKLLFIILIIFAILSVQSIVILGRQELKARQNRKYAQTIEELREKQTELSVSLIYSDPTKSKKLFGEVRQLLDQLPQKTEKQKDSHQIFYNKYITVLNKFYRLIVVENPKLSIDLTKIDKNISTSGLTNIGNDFYIFNPENNRIYLFNVSTEEAQIVNDISANVGRLRRLSPLDNDSLIGYDQNQELITFNTLDKKLLPLKFDADHEISEIKDLFVYNGRIYILEPLNNQVYKFTKTIDGFGREEAWIQDNANISDALCFAADGAIYVFKKSGQIFKFYQNKRIDFALDDIEPVLSVQNPSIIDSYKTIKLFTDTDMRYLYLLDGPSKRLIIYSKKGQLIKQITSPVFIDLKDFIVNRAETKAWLLNGTKIYEVELK